MAETSSTRILVVSDDRAHSEALCGELRGRGHVAVAVGSVAEGLEQLRHADYEVGLFDLMLPDGSGIDVLRQAAADEIPIEVIVLTAPATAGTALEAMKAGAYDYLTKPARVEDLDVRVAKAGEKARLRRENAALKARLQKLDARPGLITEDPSMRELLAATERAAASDLPLLIVGEGGTGKELVARAVHQMGPRAGHAFVAVQCGALPDGLMESEIFGQEKGGSAAGARRPGLLEVAERGVLFLDDVGALAPAVQAKLLRAIEAREFVRVGGSRPVRCDVRLFAASRNDALAERLGGITLKVPPLRDRPADVPLLARHFVDRYDGRKKLTPRALEALQRYPWPGNVRELQILIRRAAVLAAKDVIDAEDLPLDLREPGGKSGPSRTGLSLAEMEKEYIELVLRQNDGHRGKTARALGIDPKTLYNKLGPERPRKKAIAS